MGFQGKRISVVLNGDKQYLKWKNFAKNKSYGSFSQMVRTLVEQGIKKESQPFDKAFQPFKNEMNALFKMVEENNRIIELIDMRINQKNGLNSNVGKVAKKIIDILAHGEKAQIEIEGMLSHDHDTVLEALVLINDLGLIGTKREKKEKIKR